MTTRHGLRARIGALALLGAALAAGCGSLDGDGGRTAGDAAAGSSGTLSRTTAPAPASGAAPASLPVYPGATPAYALRDSMLTRWVAAGEPAATFAPTFGERILWSEDAWEDVRAFYLPLATRVLMDHEMEFPEVGSQKMLTGIFATADGTLVKFTVTRPFFRYPDRRRVDRTVIQTGPLVTGDPAAAERLAEVGRGEKREGRHGADGGHGEHGAHDPGVGGADP